MEQYIIDKLSKNGFTYKKISDPNIPIIYDIYKNDIMYNTQNGQKVGNYDEILLYQGIYCEIKNKIEEMKKCHIMAAELGNTTAMINLGNYYRYMERNNKDMKKYYLMAIKMGNSIAMSSLGHYYYTNEKYKKMKKYYKMAVRLNNVKAIYGIGTYYGKVKGNYDKMAKYYLMVITIDKNNNELKNVISRFYKNNISKDIVNSGIHVTNKYDAKTEYYILKKSFKYKYIIDVKNNYDTMLKYRNSMAIRGTILIVLGLSIKLSVIFINYDTIMTLLHIIKRSNIMIDKVIKIGIIYDCLL